ncbi:MAG TPA: PAS domain S-box protein, partial [Stenomitos sp.]
MRTPSTPHETSAPGGASGPGARSCPPGPSRLEEQLAEAQRLARLGSWERNLQANRVTWSDELFRIFGLRPQAFAPTYEAFLDRLHPEDRPRVRAIIDQAMSDHRPYAYDARVVCPDGAIRLIQARGKVDLDAGGQVARFLGTVQDVTDQRRVEQSLQASEARYRLLAEHATDIIVRMSPEGIFLYVSPACRRILGYEPDELIGHSTFETVHPDDVALVNRLRLDALAAPNVVSGGIYRRRRKDGQYIWLETTTQAICDPVTGNVSEGITVARDVTERIRLQAALQDRERKFRSLFDTAFQFLGLLTPDGTLIEVNHSALDAAGLRREDVIGRPFWETGWWSASSDAQRQLQEDIRQAAHGAFLRREVTSPAADGGTIFIDFSIKPACDETGQIVWLVAEGARRHRPQALGRGAPSAIRATKGARSPQERFRQRRLARPEDPADLDHGLCRV